ncbi:MAG: hypothetical protein P0Y53_19335 [Candidatus Pseudobacter hemicellulosilyticus]|uniref:DUF4397 domain-containing protein n=1 Tax=Candidatus Pseudobacter hemicellulosilyticus TaxID=3121375 RepID=A0AAJ5WPZ2_9BACT|nr:MAG: hypothetical protein P0Y53_19335 [Pseudobacter sp.]
MRAILFTICVSALLLITASCSKETAVYDKEPTTFLNYRFENRSQLASQGGLGLKYQGVPLPQGVFGGTFVPGKAVFTFYNTRTGATLLETEMDLKPDMETLYVFQPDSNAAPVLLSNTQLNEPPPPAGYFKLKIASFCINALSPRLDIVLNMLDADYIPTIPVDTIESVGTSFDGAPFYLIKKDPVLPSYALSFIDHNTKETILDKAGNRYITPGMIEAYNPIDIYTYYLTEEDPPEMDIFLFKNNRYYNIGVYPLF